MGGALASTKLFRRKRSVESEAPSTALRAVPLPRYRGGGSKSDIVLAARFFSRPSFAHHAKGKNGAATPTFVR